MLLMDVAIPLNIHLYSDTVSLAASIGGPGEEELLHWLCHIGEVSPTTPQLLSLHTTITRSCGYL